MMTTATFLLATASLFGTYIVLNVVYISATALTGAALRLYVQRIALFIGPRLLSFRLGDTIVSLGGLPIGSFVRLAASNDAADDSDESWYTVPLWRRVLCHLAGPLGLLCCAFPLLGVSATKSTFEAAYSLPLRLATASVKVSTLPPSLLESLMHTGTGQFLGMASVYLAAFNLYPIPILAGGLTILEVIHTIHPISVRAREQLLLMGLVLLVNVFAVLMYFYIRHGIAILRGAA